MLSSFEGFEGWPHILESQQFSKNWITRVLFPLAVDMENVLGAGGNNELANKRMITFFWEPSTRTRCSFQMAMDFLGGRVPFSTENAKEFSSTVKGETLEDTISVLFQYRPDVIVMRHSEDYAAKKAAEIMTNLEKKGGKRIAIVNAGDGRAQHPTQALLDLFTIWRCLHQIDDLSVALVGDLANGRTVRSLAYLLAKFVNVTLYFIAPEGSGIKDDIKEYLNKHRVRFYEGKDLREVAPKANVIYQTRIQKERGGNIDRNNHSLGYFNINPDTMGMLSPNKAIVMHPMPRNEEIATSVDEDPRAVYKTDQILSGLLVRMALLRLILAPKFSM